MGESKKYMVHDGSYLMGVGDSPEVATRNCFDDCRANGHNHIEFDVYEAVPIEPRSIMHVSHIFHIARQTREMSLFGSGPDHVAPKRGPANVYGLIDEAAQLAFAHIKEGLEAHYGVDIVMFSQGDFVATRVFNAEDGEDE